MQRSRRIIITNAKGVTKEGSGSRPLHRKDLIFSLRLHDGLNSSFATGRFLALFNNSLSRLNTAYRSINKSREV